MKKRMFLALIIIVVVIVVYLALHLFAYLETDSYKKNTTIEIVGHRGAAGLAPENTLAAIRMGLENGANEVEIDIHLTVDNEIVVCHDQTIDRTTTGHGKIHSLTLSEIRAVNVRVGDSITDLKIPTLQEVIDCVSEYPTGKLLIEFKAGSCLYPQIEQKVITLLDDNEFKERTIIQSFSDDVLTTIHDLDSTVMLEKLFFFKLWGLPLIIDNGISYFSHEKYKYISSFNVLYNGLTSAQAKKYRAMGKNLKVFTLETVPQRLDSNISGVITNRPDLWIHE